MGRSSAFPWFLLFLIGKGLVRVATITLSQHHDAVKGESTAQQRVFYNEVSMTRARQVRAVLEREGIGPSVWGERDCITLVRSMIRELSGRDPLFDRPTWAEGMTEREAILQAPRECGSLFNCLADLLDSDPLLKRSVGFVKPGDVVLLKSGWLATLGQDYEVWMRTATGLSRVSGDIALAWEILCRS